MNRDNIEKEIKELEKKIKDAKSELDETRDDDNRKALEDQISELEEKLDELKEQLERTDEAHADLTDDTPVVNESSDKYQKQIKENKKDIAKLEKALNKAKGDQKLFIESQIKFLKEQNDRLQSISNDIAAIKGLKNDSSISKKDKKTKKAELSKNINETKKEIRKSGTFSNVISNIFGQVDKRFTNFIYKSNRIYKRVLNARTKRYNDIFSYTFPRSIVIGVAAVLGTVVPGSGILIGLGVLYAGAVVLPKTIAALVRIAKKTPPTINRNKEISKGSYLDNIKGAWYKFTKTRGLKNNKVVTRQNTDKPRTNPRARAAASEDTNQLVNNFVNAVSNLEENYDKCEQMLRNNGDILNKVSDEVKEKYKKHELEYLTSKIKSLDPANVDKKLVEYCNKRLEKLKARYGEDITNEIAAEADTKILKDCETVLSALDGKKNPYIESCLIDLRNFKLEDTRLSVQNASQLLNKFSDVVEVMKNSSLYKEGYEEYCKLEKAVKLRQNVFGYVDVIKSVKVSELSYDTFLMLMNDAKNFTKDKDDLEVFSNIIKGDDKFKENYRKIIKNSRQFLVKEKVDKIDFNASHEKNDYSEIDNVVKMAQGYDQMRSGNLKSMENALSGETKDKLLKAREVYSQIMAGYEMKCDLTVDGENIKVTYKDYNDNEQTVVLETKFDKTISHDENILACKEEIARKTFVPSENIRLRVNVVSYSEADRDFSRGSRR